jgi:hypothetical protein
MLLSLSSPLSSFFGVHCTSAVAVKVKIVPAQKEKELPPP